MTENTVKFKLNISVLISKIVLYVELITVDLEPRLVEKHLFLLLWLMLNKLS